VRVADYFRQAHVEIRHLDFLFLTGGKPEPCGARVCEQYGSAFGVFSRVAPVQVDGRFFTFFRLSPAIRRVAGRFYRTTNHIPGMRLAEPCRVLTVFQRLADYQRDTAGSRRSRTVSYRR